MSKDDVASFTKMVRGVETPRLGRSIIKLNGLSMPDMLSGLSQLSAEDLARFAQVTFGVLDCRNTPVARMSGRVMGCVTLEGLPEAKQIGAGIERIRFAYHVVEKKAVPASVPDSVYQTGQMKEAYEFLRKAPPTRNVWATCIGSVCEDARLRLKSGSSTVPISPTDQTYGQAGYDIGIKYGTRQFMSLKESITKLCKPNLIKRLALNAHGEPGKFGVSGTDADFHLVLPSLNGNPDNTETEFGDMWDFLNQVMAKDGILLLHGCQSGAGKDGSALLCKLSQLLGGRKVVGFTTIGFQSMEKQRRDGEQCREPGARDTPYGFHGQSSGPTSEYERYFKDGDWDDLSKLPWESETSLHAKVAEFGGITRGKEF